MNYYMSSDGTIKHFFAYSQTPVKHVLYVEETLVCMSLQHHM